MPPYPLTCDLHKQAVSLRIALREINPVMYLKMVYYDRIVPLTELYHSTRL